MKVGDKVYDDPHVGDGLYDSLNSLKAPNMDEYMNLPYYTEGVNVYNHILKLASNGKKIPSISLSKGEELLRRLRPSVSDYFSITSLHFLHSGKEGLIHFVYLLNQVINDINSSSIPELNTIWAIILYKNGKKDPESDRSWRTISCCPMVFRAMDMYIRV